MRTVGSVLPGGYTIFGVKQGGMGVVYLASEPRLQLRFAVKTFQDQLFTSYESVARFRCEGRTWISLGAHPHIVRAVFVKRIDKKPHIFLEYVEGPNLKELIGGSPLPLPLALDIALQLCDGMVYARRRLGVVHRDLKPANVLLTTDGVAKITDFGLTLVFGRDAGESPAAVNVDAGGVERTREGVGMGTPGYMPPEQWTDARAVDVRADVYSFAAMLYEMLCGRLPFTVTPGEPSAALLDKQLSSAPVHPREYRDDVSDGFARMLYRCLDKDPGARLRDFDEVRASLLALHEAGLGEAWQSHAPRHPTEEVSSAQLTLEAMSCAALEDHEQAVAKFEEALRHDAENATLMRMKGESHLRLGDTPEAMRSFREAEALAPDDPDLQTDLAHCLNSMKQHDSALKHAELSIALDAHHFSGWNNKGIALFHLGRVSEADAALRKALELDPHSEETWNNRGFLLARVGNGQEAAVCLQRAITLNPRYAQPYFNYSDLLCSEGRVEEGLRVMEQLLEVEPHDRNALRIRSALADFLRQRVR
jgi:serine/threonine protein kinase